MLAILAAALLAAAPAQHDTVYTSDGGRIVGTVIEESQQAVSVQLADGSVRRLDKHQVTRIEYSDGTVSQGSAAPRVAPPPPAATPPAPPPAYPPPPPQRPPTYAPYGPPPYGPPPYGPRPVRVGPAETGPAAPVWFSFGIGALFLGGDAEPNVPMSQIFGTQTNIQLEGGVRLNPHWGLGLYLDAGVGGPGSDVRAYCDANFLDCSASTVRFGALARYTFEPFASSTPWLSLGTGWTSGDVTANGSYDTVARYSGWEMIRLNLGYDLRSNRVFGVGLYGGVAFGRYNTFENSTGSVGLSGTSTHTTVEAGVRLTLFP